MKIIRWLLSHFFLILLIVVVIYSYMFWGNLAGEDTPAGKAIAYLSSEFVEVREFVDAIKAKQQAASAEKTEPGDETQVVSRAETGEISVPAMAASEAVVQGDEIVADNAPTEKSDKPSADATSSAGSHDAATDAVPATAAVPAGTEIEVPPVSISYEYKQVQVKQDSSGKREEMQKLQQEAATAAGTPAPDTAMAGVDRAETTESSATQVVTSQAATSGSGTFVPPETVEQLKNVDSHGHIIDVAKQNDAVREAWITARKSYYLRNYRLSEDSYRKVIENTEDNFDAYGELGNVYFNQGKKAQAAEAYFEAASILVRKGQVQRARSLIGLLRHLDRAKAAELQKLIDSAVS